MLVLAVIIMLATLVEMADLMFSDSSTARGFVPVQLEMEKAFSQ